jgi:hypothetical protein
LVQSCSICTQSVQSGSARSIITILKKTFKFKIGVLWATIAQEQQILGDYI